MQLVVQQQQQLRLLCQRRALPRLAARSHARCFTRAALLPFVGGGGHKGGDRHKQQQQLGNNSSGRSLVPKSTSSATPPKLDEGGGGDGTPPFDAGGGGGNNGDGSGDGAPAELPAGKSIDTLPAGLASHFVILLALWRGRSCALRVGG